MDTGRLSRLDEAVNLWAHFGTSSKLQRAFRNGPIDTPPTAADQEIPRARLSPEEQVARLMDQRVDAWLVTDSDYPPRLRQVKAPPPVLFTWGNRELLAVAGVGMCGSRHASERGLKAARACGLAVARHGLTIISGYAQGVDTETHLAALSSGGCTIIVLAEGILHFKKKRAFNSVGLDPSRVLVISQFAPSQTWNVGAAMSRNSVIAGLGRALVVVEAAETGGTLNAGLTALRMGRPVIALDFGTDTPDGNRILFQQGAIAVTDLNQLNDVIHKLSELGTPTAEQLSFGDRSS